MSYDEPKILSSQLNQFCLIGVDGGHRHSRPLDVFKSRRQAMLVGATLSLAMMVPVFASKPQPNSKR